MMPSAEARPAFTCLLSSILCECITYNKHGVTLNTALRLALFSFLIDFHRAVLLRAAYVSSAFPFGSRIHQDLFMDDVLMDDYYYYYFKYWTLNTLEWY